MRTEQLGVTPSFSEVVNMLIDSALVDMNVCLPGKIVTYNSKTQYADVQVQLKRKYEQGPALPLPIIPNVPVVHPRAFSGTAFIHMPLQIGDDVTLVFSQRSLDNWKTQGGLSDPSDRRKFNISDAIAFIGGSSLPSAFLVDDPNSIEITNGPLTKLQIKPGGKYKISGGTGDELIKFLDDVIKSLQKIRVATILGPQPLIDPSDPGFVLLLARIEAFKS